MSMPDSTDLPVVVIGAGPVGLAAAAHLTERGIRTLVLERGARAGAAVREWGHVRLFSTWRELIDPAAERLLAPTGWVRPEAGRYPTGAEWAAEYLQPLADALGERVRYGATVTGVARAGRDRVVDSGRAHQPFTVHLTLAEGDEAEIPSGTALGAPPSVSLGAPPSVSWGRISARAVIDASGTYGTPNPLGADGYPAEGEQALAARGLITYRVPDFGDPAVRARFAGRRTAVVGTGASAFTALAGLAALARTEEGAGTHAVWVLRRGISGSTFGGGSADQLPARGALGLAAKAALDEGHAHALTGFRTAAVAREGDRLVLAADDGRRTEPVDQVIVLTGLRPDLSFLAEVRLGLDERLSAPAALAPLIDPNRHSCGTVRPHGAAELSHPEEGLFLAGMKSYGRAPTFLAMTGYEQVRSLAAALAGDTEAARRVELTLPETGVCGGAGLFDEAAGDAGTAGGCCAPGPRLIPLGVGAPDVAAARPSGGCCG
ncbi:FAD-dependent oxidoreductase [Streptomyces hoynatensis]|uniref:FAD-binding protein n=1 Tax=Streptomyces hoynatensis TaxID=1141874 RepID=A0A3A9YVY8_9ACTN|nr:FAD-dependent oxidoreductase [Streptomyces hoynatensis]RKN40145.1 FAD-binding protein [Streptomyces hoynatensis]